MFGKKKLSGKIVERNVLVLDIENASVGVALAHLRQGTAPVLFAEHRIALAMPQTLISAGIAKQIEKAAHSALEHLGLVAARLRGNPKTAQKGEFTDAAVFLGAPWGVPNLAAGKSDFSPRMQTFITNEISAYAPDVPLSFYTNADAAGYGGTLRGQEGTVLVAMVRGEITELMLLGGQRALGYGTLPMGSHSIYRTLQTHAGLSLAEIPAVLALAQHPANPYSEPLEAAGRHMIEHLAPGLEALTQGGTPGGVIIVAEEPVAEWFALTLESDESLGALFTPNATVRTFSAKHAATHLGGHGMEPDLHLSLDALFADAKLFSGV